MHINPVDNDRIWDFIPNLRRNIRARNWEKFAEAIDLDIKKLDDKTKIDTFKMKVKPFKQLLGIRGRMPGYYDVPNTFLAGGALLSWLAGEQPKDRDYFGYTLDDCQAMVDFLMTGHEFVSHVGNYTPFESGFDKGMDDPVLDVKRLTNWYPGTRGKYIPDHWISVPTQHDEDQEYVRALNFTKNGNPIMQQVILLIKGQPHDVIRSFDLSISQLACDGEYIYWGDNTIQDLIRGTMRIERIHHPMSTMRRIIKYSNRGWWACNGAILDASNAMAEYAKEREAAGLDPLADAVISLD